MVNEKGTKEADSMSPFVPASVSELFTGMTASGVSKSLVSDSEEPASVTTGTFLFQPAPPSSAALMGTVSCVGFSTRITKVFPSSDTAAIQSTNKCVEKDR